MSELHKYLAAYDEDDQDRTPSDFTTVRLAQGRIAALEDTLKARTDALGRVAETNQRLRDAYEALRLEHYDCANLRRDIEALTEGLCDCGNESCTESAWAIALRAVLEGGR